MLERVVKLDGTYAPAWFALSSRSYADARFGGGGDAMLERSDAAAEQALALDADYVDAAAELYCTGSSEAISLERCSRPGTWFADGRTTHRPTIF